MLLPSYLGALGFSSLCIGAIIFGTTGLQGGGAVMADGYAGRDDFSAASAHRHGGNRP